MEHHAEVLNRHAAVVALCPLLPRSIGGIRLKSHSSYAYARLPSPDQFCFLTDDSLRNSQATQRTEPQIGSGRATNDARRRRF